MILNIQQEQIVPERSARLNLDPDRVDKGVGGDGGEIRDDRDEGGAGDHLQEAGPSE